MCKQKHRLLDLLFELHSSLLREAKGIPYLLICIFNVNRCVHNIVGCKHKSYWCRFDDIKPFLVLFFAYMEYLHSVIVIRDSYFIKAGPNISRTIKWDIGLSRRPNRIALVLFTASVIELCQLIISFKCYIELKDKIWLITAFVVKINKKPNE